MKIPKRKKKKEHGWRDYELPKGLVMLVVLKKRK